MIGNTIGVPGCSNVESSSVTAMKPMASVPANVTPLRTRILRTTIALRMPASWAGIMRMAVVKAEWPYTTWKSVSE